MWEKRTERQPCHHVPEARVAVTTSGEYRSIVRAPSDGENFIGMIEDTAQELAGSHIPNARLAIIAPGQQLGAIGIKGDGPNSMPMDERLRPDRLQCSHVPQRGNLVLTRCHEGASVWVNGHGVDFVLLARDLTEEFACRSLPNTGGFVTASGYHDSPYATILPGRWRRRAESDSQNKIIVPDGLFPDRLASRGIPKHGGMIAAAGGKRSAVGTEGDRVDLVGMRQVVD
jgi:hypothetical protein